MTDEELQQARKLCEPTGDRVSAMHLITLREKLCMALDEVDRLRTTRDHSRLDDCILAKLNIREGKPRINRKAKPSDRDAWQVGFATALAEMHRRLIGGADSKSVVAVARGAGVTIRSACAAGASAYDLKELKRAGVR